MKRNYIRCRNEIDGVKCGNVLGYVAGNRFYTQLNGRTVAISSNKGGESITVTCEHCGGQTVIQPSIYWRVKK